MCGRWGHRNWSCPSPIQFDVIRMIVLDIFNINICSKFNTTFNVTVWILELNDVSQLCACSCQVGTFWWCRPNTFLVDLHQSASMTISVTLTPIRWERPGGYHHPQLHVASPLSEREYQTIILLIISVKRIHYTFLTNIVSFVLLLPRHISMFPPTWGL